MTPSNASLSPNASSFRRSQYSSTSLALGLSSSNRLTCALSSSSVKLASAASVTVQSILVAPKSNSGAGGRPFRLRPPFVESTDVDDPFCCFNFVTEPFGRTSDDGRGDWESARRCMEGRISFFCLLAGRISSKSTGTPRETRKRRRIRERTQFGG